MTESFLNDLESRRDRLVANVVAAVEDPARLRKLLAEIDDVPEGWRALATRLLEERVLECRDRLRCWATRGPLVAPHISSARPKGRVPSIGSEARVSRHDAAVWPAGWEATS
jgi:hypothetical protein